jgi:hypothetical protein
MHIIEVGIPKSVSAKRVKSRILLSMGETGHASPAVTIYQREDTTNLIDINIIGITHSLLVNPLGLDSSKQKLASVLQSALGIEFPVSVIFTDTEIF